MSRSKAVKISSLALLGGPLAAGIADQAQAADGDFEALCGTTVTSDTVVSDFSDILTSTCDIDVSNATLLVENGTINAGGYSVDVDGFGDAAVHFENVHINNGGGFDIWTASSNCDTPYGYGMVTVKGKKNSAADINVDTFDINAGCDVLVKWVDLDLSGTDDVDIESRHASLAVIDNSLEAPLADLDLDAYDSILVKDNTIDIDESQELSIQTNSSTTGEINIKDNTINLNSLASVDVSVEAYGVGGINITGNSFSNDQSGSLSVDAYGGSVIYKSNSFDGMDVDTYDAGACQDSANGKVNTNPSNPCTS